MEGINIRTDKNNPYSLGNKLTNPNWYAKNLFDVESHYKSLKADITAPDLSDEQKLKYDMLLMYKLQCIKFRKHPNLIDEINDMGGLSFLHKCSHNVVGNIRWEGNGLKSNFIKVLSKSYQTVSTELNKFIP